MNTFSVSRLTLALAFGVTLSACSSTPADQQPSTQTAPGTVSRPVLTADEAKNFTPASYFQSLDPNAAAWTPAAISIPSQPDFVVGPAGAQGVTHTTIQAAVDAAIARHSDRRQFIAIMPGEYTGTVYVPAAPGALTLYGTGEKPLDVKISQAIDSEMDVNTWRHLVNPAGKYMPGKPAWYMFDSCQSKRAATVGVMCSAVFWSQNNGLQLQNLTIANNLGDSVDAGTHQAVALRSDGDQVQINNVNILGRQNTFFVTNSGVQNRLQNDRQTRTLVSNSYIEGDVDIVSGRGAVVFDNTDFRVVNSRTQKEAYVFAPATLKSVTYGFLAVNSRFTASGDGVAQLGRSLDVDSATSGQVVIRDSAINEGFNVAKPWADAAISSRPFSGNTGAVDAKGVPQRNLNDSSFNRMWEYNNRGVGSVIVAEPKQ
ncbi:TPA: putative acyl-CoA thioester hydrolase [Raoultella ornithinolytica]|uniref:putative acyl-CoA thioester hydrolase n=1 Tax=Raoultella ornithinolytica TaxID=54291 RepID=UPI0010E83CB1|nr:putative acyl-CoA thioester hydrolase [Raoultella ornithinolytica]EKV0505332.1 putative acyl-CoA thioester hydrolase [Raoultella ornithinolytica]EKV6724021.1 putative acyl-CoA thioester hydrolase [Raoultella ornithinolytica]EMF1903271.1 putative acyl-CoA thioester hydrolase [Raoultella ornithinolytica]MDL4580356.1 putative acyl-CoA thioester hydrolase [Raoultella ornithinolytica]VTN62408.1 Putative acyl-CoA thioester hydrolase ybhC precursor [Raoultella ornithinolytica]